MKLRFISIMVLAALTFLGCSQVDTTNTNPEPNDVELADQIAEMPDDYEGVWLRTAVIVDGKLENNSPAILTLNKTDYTSVGTCNVVGKVIKNSSDSLTLTIDGTTCPGISTGGSATYTYTMQYDEERSVETMTTVTGPLTETYDRQS